MDFVHVYWGLEGIYHLSACDTSHLRVTTSNEKRKKQADPARNRNKVYSLYMFVNLHVLLYIFVWCIRVFILVLFQASWSRFEPLGERQSLLCRCGAAYSSKQINVTLNLHAQKSSCVALVNMLLHYITLTYHFEYRISLSLVLHHQMDIGWRAVLLKRRLETRHRVPHIIWIFDLYS